MPLDGHSYLVAQGWAGKGTGLRKGAISRPLAIPQKKTLAGLGKDRDEAFPFWDHLFSAAAKSIQLKCTNDGEDEVGELSHPEIADFERLVKDDTSAPEFQRTTTGILSNRRPVTGTPADSSGTTTPDADQLPRSSLMTIAKREAAKRGLYARFFRGSVLGPNSLEDDEMKLSVSEAVVEFDVEESIVENIPKKKRKVSKDGDGEEWSRKKQKRELKVKLKEEKTSKKRRKGEHDFVDDIAKAKSKKEKRRKRELKEVERKLAQNGKTSKGKKDKPRQKENEVIQEEEEILQDTPIDEPPDRLASDKDQRRSQDAVDVPHNPERREKKKWRRKDTSP